MNSSCYRQGDVFIIPMASLPGKGIRKSHGGVLALGEVTGHAHRLADPGQAEVFTIDQQMYLDVPSGGAEIIHEEHGTITLPRGAYAVRIQREYTPAGIRRVYD
jgi:hypothetical protein